MVRLTGTPQPSSLSLPDLRAVLLEAVQAPAPEEIMARNGETTRVLAHLQLGDELDYQWIDNDLQLTIANGQAPEPYVVQRIAYLLESTVIVRSPQGDVLGIYDPSPVWLKIPPHLGGRELSTTNTLPINLAHDLASDAIAYAFAPLGGHSLKLAPRPLTDITSLLKQCPGVTNATGFDLDTPTPLFKVYSDGIILGSKEFHQTLTDIAVICSGYPETKIAVQFICEDEQAKKHLPDTASLGKCASLTFDRERKITSLQFLPREPHFTESSLVEMNRSYHYATGWKLEIRPLTPELKSAWDNQLLYCDAQTVATTQTDHHSKANLELALPRELHAKILESSGSLFVAKTPWRMLPEQYVTYLSRRLQALNLNVLIHPDSSLPPPSSSDLCEIVRRSCPAGIFTRRVSLRDNICRLEACGLSVSPKILASTYQQLSRFLAEGVPQKRLAFDFVWQEISATMHDILSKASPVMRELILTEGDSEGCKTAPLKVTPDGTTVTELNSLCAHLSTKAKTLVQQTHTRYRVPDTARWEKFHRQNLVDFTGQETCTIDRSGARFGEDAYTISLDRSGAEPVYTVMVHLARVSRVVTPGSDLAMQAFSRGGGIYGSTGGVIPMLPAKLIHEEVALHAGARRFTWTICYKISASQGIHDGQIVEGIIKNKHELSFDEATKKVKIGSSTLHLGLRMMRNCLRCYRPSNLALDADQVIESHLSIAENITRQQLLGAGLTSPSFRASGAMRDLRRLACQWQLEALHGYLQPLPSSFLDELQARGITFDKELAQRRTELAAFEQMKKFSREVSQIYWGAIGPLNEKPIKLRLYDEKAGIPYAVIDTSKLTLTPHGLVAPDNQLFNEGSPCAGRVIGIHVPTGAPLIELKLNYG